MPSATVPVASTPILLFRTIVPLAAAPKIMSRPAITLPSAMTGPPIVLPLPPWTVTDANAGVPTAAVPLALVPTKLAVSVFPGAVIHTFRLLNPLITRPLITFPALLTSKPLFPAPALDPSTTTRAPEA